jgi:hypothetical protein
MGTQKGKEYLIYPSLHLIENKPSKQKKERKKDKRNERTNPNPSDVP